VEIRFARSSRERWEACCLAQLPQKHVLGAR
jgi:hypothetical protein